ncbi:MAG TPA: VWA domain-containing protein [Jiangellales bacterium]|nr:VWA domain-containing protein [Jiangellales bacterium]
MRTVAAVLPDDPLVPAVVGFARTLRAAGVDAAPGRVHAMLDALGHLDPAATGDVYWSGRLTVCGSPADIRTYDRAFAAYFGEAGVPLSVRRPVPSVVVHVAVPDGSDAAPSGDGGDAEAVRTATASRVEVLRHRDLAALDDKERAEVDRMLSLLTAPGPVRRSRRRVASRRGRLDVGRTVRATLREGGETMRLRRHDRVDRPRRTVFLVDVSGSMAPYADAVLRVAHACCRRRPATEVFTMGTRLTRVTREMQRPDADAAMAGVAHAVPDWSGGTRLGTQVGAFLDRWGRRGMARGAVVVVASDGWERGDTTALGEQMARLARLARAVVWISPHAGRDGFAPLVGGLQAALPSVDALVAGHDLAAMERLVATVGQVGRRA